VATHSGTASGWVGNDGMRFCGDAVARWRIAARETDRGEDKRKEVHGCGSASRAAEEVAAKGRRVARRGGVA
jgi:hypothetical protein